MVSLLENAGIGVAKGLYRLTGWWRVHSVAGRRCAFPALVEAREILTQFLLDDPA